MKGKSKKFNMRLSPQEYRALMLLATRDGVSMSAWLVKHIRQQAESKGIPL